ncbi:MAG: AMP-binding enzyme [Myxococcaceae bacterium]
MLAAHPGVAEVAVVGRPDGRGGQVPVAVVVLGPGATLGDLESWARARLAAFKVPAEVFPASALPRTAAGKVDRAAVQAAVTAPSGPCTFEKAGAAESTAGRMEFK